MSRYRLIPTPAQQAVLRDHCAHARYVWNLAVEQHSHWHPGRANAPGYLEQCRQLTQARAAFYAPGNPAGRPSWRKAGRDEGFRITGQRRRQWDVRRLSRKPGQVWVPKAGWVRFRWSRAVPPGVKSYRVTMDRAGRWHVAFAVIPTPVPAPGNGQVVGIDRGVAVSAALSTGQPLHAPARTARGSNRRGRAKYAIARLRARETDRRKDWAEKTSTDLTRRFDLIRVEDLQIKNMTRSAKGTRENPGRNVRQKAGLNRGILRAGWGLLGRRAGGPGLAREPSRLPVHCLRFRRPRGRERGEEHRGGARRDCAGRRRGSPAREPRTSTAAPTGVVAGIPRLQAGRMSNAIPSTLARHIPYQADKRMSKLVLDIIVVLVIVCIGGFFSASEMALV